MWLPPGKLYIEHCKNKIIFIGPWMFVFVFKCILCVLSPPIFLLPPMMQLFLYLHNFFVMIQMDIARVVYPDGPLRHDTIGST